MSEYAQLLDDETVAVFLFHGVIRKQRHAVRNYTRKHLELDRFTTVLDDLLAAGSPVSLPELVAATRGDHDLPPRAFAVTFDDGFANNLTLAAPVLADRGVPATFYVTSDFVDRNTSSWIDLIEYAVERAGPSTLHLPFAPDGGRYATPGEKIALLEAIRRHVKTSPAVDPYAFAADVWRRLGITDLEPDPELDQKLTWEQVGELARHELFTVGGHGRTHRILAYLAPGELEEEVQTSLERLRPHVAGPVEHYSYPEGLAGCYSDRVIELLRAHGIVCAPTAEPGVNRVGDDLFRLRRVQVV